MTDKAFDVRDQMSRSRYNHKEGRHERLENGVWVPWPVLKMDRYGQHEVGRIMEREERRER